MYRFELRKGTKREFWEIHLDDKTIFIRSGRIGAEGRPTKQTFPSHVRANIAHGEMFAAKLRQGYRLVSEKTARPSEAKSKAKREGSANSDTKAKGPLSKLVKALFAAKQELERQKANGEYRGTFGKPATQAQIKVLEKRLGKPLPPSYRAFLELHNGWIDFAGGASLLSIEAQSADWVKRRVRSLRDLFGEYETSDPFNAGMIPVLLGAKDQMVLLVDPSSTDAKNEMTFIQYDLSREVKRYEGFTSFLKNDLQLTNRLIAKRERNRDSGNG